ncbi:MAG: hypothetical protein ACYCXG_11785 [Acidiferrobacter sp.]
MSGSFLSSFGSGLQTAFGDLTSGAQGLSNDVSNVLGQNGTLTIGGTTIHTGTQPVTTGANGLRGNQYPTTAAGAASIFGGLGSSLGSIFSGPMGIILIIILVIAVA